MTMYLAGDTELEAVADAIRAKGGTSSELEWPSEFISAIQSISGGGGGSVTQDQDGFIVLPSTGGGGGTSALKEFVIRPDAELILSYSNDSLIVEDDGITIPSYTTTGTILENVGTGGSLTLDSASYSYLFISRFLAYPIYATGTGVAAGRFDYFAGCGSYEIMSLPAGSICSLDGNVSTSLDLAGYSRGSITKSVYWSGASAISMASGQNGTYVVAPAYSANGNAYTFRRPPLYIKGSATYLNETFWNAIEDIRFQYICEVYRAPLSADTHGWYTTQSLERVFSNVKNDNGTLD